MSVEPRVWLITGTSTGIGREIALAALRRGDLVVATARAGSISKLETLRSLGADVLELDVAGSPSQINAVAEQALRIHGRIDVLVNNAGYGHVGALEELTFEETTQQFNTNVFGGLSLAQACLPHMRERKSGTIIWIGSITEWSAIPGCGIYAASKAATRALAEVLDAEVKPLGLRSINVEFGFTRTEGINNMVLAKSQLDAYRPFMEPGLAALKGLSGNEPVDAVKGAEIVVDIVHGEGCAAGREVPSVVGLGSDWLASAEGFCKRTLEGLKQWEGVTKSVDFPTSSGF